MSESKKKKLVVLGGKSFVVDVLGDNPHIKGSAYVRYQDGGTDSFKPRFLIDLPESYNRLEQENAELREALKETVELSERFVVAALTLAKHDYPQSPSSGIQLKDWKKHDSKIKKLINK